MSFFSRRVPGTHFNASPSQELAAFSVTPAPTPQKGPAQATGLNEVAELESLTTRDLEVPGDPEALSELRSPSERDVADLSALSGVRRSLPPALSDLPRPDADIFEGPGGLRVYTVLVADDAPSTRQALAELLEDTSDLVCVAAVGDAGAAIAQAAHFQPDVAVLDVLMPGGGGLAAALGIREVSPRTRLLAYSAAADRSSVVQMLRSGARGYLVKGSPAHDLLEGLRRCAEGATALSAGLSDHLIAEMGELGRAERAFSAAAKARYERLYQLLQPGVSSPMYQPVVYLRTGDLAGYEALTDFTAGPSFSTEDIFREAHHVGLGVELELHTARMAVAGFREALQRTPGAYLAVNASPGLLYRPALLEVLADLPPSRVVVEITEQRQFDSYDQLRETVCLVHERGMRVAVDDMGSGFAGLQRLVDVRPEIVKLDRALTSQIDTDPPRRALVTAMRQFADDMGIVVVAEGIEREEQLVVLRDIGVDCGQGYLLGRPAPLPV
ncbi:MAG TPA: EAL domain-containing protein [Acidimicrobiales bacterium]|nr:EAL domain-containing protein [Acidimicrobiales bacterium]